MPTTVRIQQSHLLNERFELPSEGLDRVVKSYREAWDKQSERTISGLEEVTGLTFAQNYIDCYIINPNEEGAISYPLIIGGGYKPREFTLLLSHELAHILADDNEQRQNWHERAKLLYPKEEEYVANHILAHAVLEALYTEVFHDTDSIIRDIRYRENYPLHKRSWDIVSEQGYKHIIQTIKEGKRGIAEGDKRYGRKSDFFLKGQGEGVRRR